MLYPYTFIIKLNPGQRCYYVANQGVQAKWTGGGGWVSGVVNEYVYRGWNGRDRDTCSLNKQAKIDQDKMYYTGDTKIGEILGKSDVCGYVMFFTNSAIDEK
jgi:hypothetical protein